VLNSPDEGGVAAITVTVLLLVVVSLAAIQPGKTSPGRPAAGVSWDLAQSRASSISDLVYDLEFRVPEAKEDQIRGRAIISLVRRGPAGPLVLDFQGPRGRIDSVRLNGAPVAWEYANGHLVLGAANTGSLRIEIEFRAGDGPLNRHEDYLYSLFVPNRASAAFPCFDQPDLKARFRLALEIPAGWTAVSNSAVETNQTVDGRPHFRFAETRPLSTYLFSFAAGRFRVEQSEWKGNPIRFLHRETDEERVRRNIGPIFDLHRKALDWLEAYTSIPYPFPKFDFVGVPAFQFSGMEHPGAILYRDSKLFLDESATQTEILERASLIAHETSHMWFGDLVTMRWFNDVWTKEVFANFIAAKIVNPSFPEINHELRFFLAHYPGAYEIDRTEGTHPIRQSLENMNDAASLYGPIIYQKAPIVMRQLELLIGEEAMKSGLQEYLRSFSYANATWPDLVAILDRRTETDLRKWSRNWVEEAGRPVVSVSMRLRNNKLESLRFSQADPLGRGLVWPQVFSPMLGYDENAKEIRIRVEGKETFVPGVTGLSRPLFVLPDSRGIAYARFELDPESRRYLLDHFDELSDPISRASAWLMLYEAMLERQLGPGHLVSALRRGLTTEREELNVNALLTSLGHLFWGFQTPEERRRVAAPLERELWELLGAAPSASLKSAYFKALMTIASTDSGIGRLREVWAHRLLIQGLSLAEQDEMRLALQLAVRGTPDYEQILNEQAGRIRNPDRKLEFDFILPSVSASAEVRDRFFEALKQASNRKHEPWVVDAVSYLHHPLRAESAVRYIRPSLDLLEEIKQTGDIFFPKRWLDATLSGHGSDEAARVVRQFLDDHPKYPARLRGKVLQSADLLFRRAAIVDSRKK